MVGQCHQSNQYEFDTIPGGSGRQEGLACSGPWCHEESDMTKRLNEVITYITDADMDNVTFLNYTSEYPGNCNTKSEICCVYVNGV